MDLSVIIVSFNTVELTIRAISSVYREFSSENLSGEVIVVDNASRDETVERLHRIKHEARSVKLEVVENKKNVGFARANNQAAKVAKGRYLLFLNSDAELSTGALTTMHRFLEDHSKVGIASCQLVNLDGSIQPQGGWLPRFSTVAIWAWFLDDLPIFRKFLPSYQFRHPNPSSNSSWSIGWVAGTAMWVRRKTWDQLGGFDESLFMYGEDVELCYRAKKRGWVVMINPTVRVIHHGRGSASNASNASGASWITREVVGLRHIFKKHKPSWEMPFLRLMLKSGMAARWVIFGILKNDPVKRVGYADAFRAS